ncbi:MAG TPA: hypothetical protein VNJ01_11895 [Bacteriovoracaceae bacterium]|nr:hypothetical protein [Bacteriovoracaceae bacterium]
MRYFLLFFFLNTAAAESVAVFTSVAYYTSLGEKFRVETANRYSGCKYTRMARKLFHEESNELREIGLLDAKGKWLEAGAENNPELRMKVEEVFFRADQAKSPCVSSTQLDQAEALKVSEQ